MRTGRISIPGLGSRGNIGSAVISGGGSAPSTPTGVGAIGGDSQVTLLWNAATGATSYHVKRSNNPSGPFSTVIGSPTGLGFTDPNVINGTPYYYVVSALNSFGESADSTIVSATPAALNLFAVPFGIIGDSTYHDEGFGDPMVGIPAELLAYSGRVATIVSNQSAPGTTSINWSDTSPGSLLSNAILAFTTGSATHVMVGLGTNDCRSITNTSAVAYRAAMLTICNTLIAAGFKVILNYPTKPLITAGSNTWPQSAIDLNLTYRPQIDSLVNGTTILQGDKGRLADFLFDNPNCYQGGTQLGFEDPLVGGFHQSPPGIAATARLLAEGIEFAVNPSARTLGNPQTLPSPTASFSNRNTYHNDWSKTAWDERIGSRYDWMHPGSPPDTRPTLYNPPDVNDPNLRDFAGTGSTIVVDTDLGHPGTNFTTIKASPAVIPWNWCLAHPGIDLGSHNYRLGLPSNASDILDPDNNPAGYHTTTGDITRDQYLANPSAYTRTGGLGDGFTPASIFLTGHRQQWANLTAEYYQFTLGGEYWSVFGQVNFIADDPTTYCGILRINSFAYYNLAFAVSPRSGGGPFVHNDTDSTGDNLFTYLYWRAFQYGDPYGARYEGPVTSFSDSAVYAVFGKKAENPICSYRSPYIVCGEAIVIDRDGMMTTLYGGTTRDGNAYPIPVYKFPTGERPIAVTLSGMNEIVVVAVWDTVANNAKLVIFAVQGYANVNHGTYWYGLSNEGSFSGFRRMGEIVLPFNCPDFVLAQSDAQLQSQPNPGLINLSDAATRANYNSPAPDSYGAYISYAKKMFVAVTSKAEGKFAMYDLSAWTDYIHSQLIGTADQTAWSAVAAAHDAGTFPPTFAARPDLAPTLDYAFDIAKPTCMICAGYGGPQIGYNYSDIYKLLIGTESGLVKVVNVTWFLDRPNFTGLNGPDSPDWARPSGGIGGTFWVGRGITSMCWRHYDVPYAEIAYTGVMSDSGIDRQNRDAHMYSNALWVCCRGDRAVKLAICRYDINTHQVLAAVHQTVQDIRMGDPVHVSVDDRTPILHVAGFNDRKVHSFQFGGCGLPAAFDGPTMVYPGVYFPVDPVDNRPVNYAGALSLPGCPINSSWNNVN